MSEERSNAAHRMFPGRRYDLSSSTQHLCVSGDYFKDASGEWRGRTPNGLYVWLKSHHVEEHGDGTISVVPGSWGSNSILAHSGMGSERWHGYIERGVWREC